MLQGQDEAGIASAAGIAASMRAGPLEANRTGGSVKRVHCGLAAHCGMAAADPARHGLTGPPTVLEGRFGSCQQHVEVVGDLGGRLGPDWLRISRVMWRRHRFNLERRPAHWSARPAS